MSGEGNIGLGGEDYARFATTKVFGLLDGLRAVAILAVVWHHANNAAPGWKIATRGFLGVDLFFTISGFLIVTLLLRERRRTGNISLRGFYARRFLRIFPAYYLLLLVVGAVAFLKSGSPSSEAVKRDLPFAVFFVSNLVPMRTLLAITWSLSVEEQFYLIVPTVEKCARSAMRFVLPLAYVFVSLPALGAFPALHLPVFFRETTFGPILLGVILAHVLDDARGYVWVSRLVGWRFAPLVALGLIFILASHPTEEFTGWPRLAVHWAMLALVASCVVRDANILAPLLSVWPMRRIGAVSYGIYLYHLLVMHFVANGLAAAGATRVLVTFIGTTLGSWAVAELSYRLFEVRFLALKSRFAPGVPLTAPTVGAERPNVAAGA